MSLIWQAVLGSLQTYSLAEKSAKCLDQQVNDQQSNSSHCLIGAQAVRHKFIVMHTASVISLVQAEHVCVPLAYDCICQLLSRMDCTA